MSEKFHNNNKHNNNSDNPLTTRRTDGGKKQYQKLTSAYRNLDSNEKKRSSGQHIRKA